MLKQVSDYRHKSYIKHGTGIILLIRILSAIFYIKSMRKMTMDFNEEICLENTCRILEVEPTDILPHWSTINNFLEKLPETELEEIITESVSHIVRMKTFESSRIRGKHWQILIDGSGIFSFGDQRHCKHCLKREHKDKDGNVKRTEYYHYVLEAKIVFGENLVFSIGTEFVENENEEVTKQDCELKAFYRLAEKLKERHKRLPMCLTMDSLYAKKPVFDVCKKNGWHYIIRFKDGSLRSVAKDFHELKYIEKDQQFSQIENGIKKEYKFVNGIDYNGHSLNFAECIQEDKEHPFVFLTDLPITRKNCEDTVRDGRRRWRIENEGFNRQKNHGYHLQHLFSKDEKAMKNHYYLIQIGHMVSQMMEKMCQKIVQGSTIEWIHEKIKQYFQTIPIGDFEVAEIKYRLRL